MNFVRTPTQSAACKNQVFKSGHGVSLIEKGLSAGETVVVQGQYRLSPVAVVTLANPNDRNSVTQPSAATSGMLP